jgi:hypothetical protein
MCDFVMLKDRNTNFVYDATGKQIAEYSTIVASVESMVFAVPAEHLVKGLSIKIRSVTHGKMKRSVTRRTLFISTH